MKTETNVAVAVKAEKVFRGARNLPGFWVSLVDAAGKAVSKVYGCVGEDAYRQLASTLCRQHRLPLIRA